MKAWRRYRDCVAVLERLHEMLKAVSITNSYSARMVIHYCRAHKPSEKLCLIRYSGRSCAMRGRIAGGTVSLGRRASWITCGAFTSRYVICMTVILFTNFTSVSRSSRKLKSSYRSSLRWICNMSRRNCSTSGISTLRFQVIFVSVVF